MKTALTAGGLGGVITAVAAAGLPALACLGMIIFVVIGGACWVITDRGRTANAVALVTAFRGNPADPAELPAKTTTRDQQKPRVGR